jgi:hypothetical protein
MAINFNKLINEYKINKEQLKKIDFIKLSSILKNVELLSRMETLLIKVSPELGKYCKKILTIFLIYLEPELMNSDKKSRLYTLSSELIDELSKNNDNKLKLLIPDYIKEFMQCHEKALFIRINDLTKIYWETENLLKTQKDLSEIDKDKCKKNQLKILNQIKLIGGDTGMKYFNSIIPTFLDDNFVKLIKENLIKSYWEEFKNKLEKSNYTMIIDCLKDTRYFMASLIPNRKDIHQELWEKIDTELIEQMINNEAIDPLYIKQLVCYIVNKIKQFGALEEEKKIKEWEDKILLDFEKGFEYSEFFPEFFQTVFKKLTELEMDITIIKNLPIYESIKNLK